MLEGLRHLFSVRPLLQIGVDVLDLAVVTVLIYRLLLVLKGTRAAQMGFGLLAVFLTYIGAKWMGLVTLQNLFSSLLSSALLIIIVVFQNDIRRALMRIGSNPLLGGLGRALETRVIDEVVAATTELARHRIGALITFEQDANLDEFVVGQGIALDSAVSRELLVTMFVPESVNKLHDGAVIIRNLRIAKAGVFFPMPEAKNIDPAYGSRHRAAIGITEETDAVVVVVSEERGTISFCFNGNIVSDLDGDALGKTLLRIFGRAGPKRKEKRKDKEREASVTTTGRVAIGTTPPLRSSTLPRTTPLAATPSPPDGPRSSRTTITPRGTIPPRAATDTPLVSPELAPPLALSTPMPSGEMPMSTRDLPTPLSALDMPGSDQSLEEAAEGTPMPAADVPSPNRERASSVPTQPGTGKAP